VTCAPPKMPATQTCTRSESAISCHANPGLITELATSRRMTWSRALPGGYVAVGVLDRHDRVRENRAVKAPDGMTVTVVAAAGLPGSLRGALHGLFDEAYSQADHGYLDKSLELLRFAAVAAAGGTAREAAAGTSRREEIIGFALGESRILDLPGLPGQRVGLAGLCCVHSAYRRRGLFRMLEAGVIAAGTDRPGSRRLLMAGRMAHPASLRVMSGNPGTLPRPGVVPSAFQQEIAREVARCYAVGDFDPLTFACRGHGRPIGYPRMDIDAGAEEWKLFASVDRDKGDSLLALSWIPDAPSGW
jgi:hypothetical protein